VALCWLRLRLIFRGEAFRSGEKLFYAVAGFVGELRLGHPRWMLLTCSTGDGRWPGSGCSFLKLGLCGDQ
jgi:hypothetical protein